MAEEKSKGGKGILGRPISFKMPERYPAKTVVNLVSHEKEIENRNFIIFLIVFVLCFLAFVYFGVFGRVRKLNEAQESYASLQLQLESLRKADADYAKVRKQYDEVTGWYLTDDEKAEVDKTGVFNMLEDDLFSFVSVTSVTMEGNAITVETGVTDLTTVSQFLKVLQSDTRNLYVTVATTNAPSARDNANAVIAEIHITYGGGSKERESRAEAQSDAADAMSTAGNAD